MISSFTDNEIQSITLSMENPFAIHSLDVTKQDPNLFREIQESEYTIFNKKDLILVTKNITTKKLYHRII